MVQCDRCHRRFSSYRGLEDHYTTRHGNAQVPSWLKGKASAEKPLNSSNRGNSRLGLGIFLLLLVVAVAVIGIVALRRPESPAGALTVGMTAPDFSLQDTAGATFRLSDYRGRSNVLLFFNEGLSCSPCLDQMRSLDELGPRFTSLNIVAASITTDSPSQLASWAMSSGPRQSRVMADQSLTVSRSYDMLGNSMHPGMVPGHSFVLVNLSGTVIWRHDYYPPSMSVPNDQLISEIENATRP